MTARNSPCATPPDSRSKASRSGGLLLIFLLLCGLASGGASSHFRRSLGRARALRGAIEERAPLYLPEVRTVRLVTLGFNALASDLLWFDTLNYFGKQFAGKKNYRWFAHMCDLVSKLDPNTGDVYEFCGTLLSWVAKEPGRSVEILSRAIRFHPEIWRYRFLRGFTYWYFLEKRALAEKDLRAAALLPGAPPFVASLASRLMAAQDDPRTAVLFLEDILKNTNDENARAALLEKLKLARLSYHLSILEQARNRYEKRYRHPLRNLAELEKTGILRSIPPEPFGGEYFIDSDTRKISSSSGRSGLAFRGKTAKTGIAKEYFSN